MLLLLPARRWVIGPVVVVPEGCWFITTTAKSLAVVVLLFSSRGALGTAVPNIHTMTRAARCEMESCLYRLPCDVPLLLCIECCISVAHSLCVRHIFRFWRCAARQGGATRPAPEACAGVTLPPGAESRQGRRRQPPRARGESSMPRVVQVGNGAVVVSE